MALVTMTRIVVNVPHDEAEKLRAISDTEQRPVAGLVRLAITDFLAKREVKEEAA